MSVKKDGGGVVEIASPAKSWWVSSLPYASPGSSVSEACSPTTASDLIKQLPSTVCVESAIYEGVFILQEMLELVALLKNETYFIARWALRHKLQARLESGFIEEGVAQSLRTFLSADRTYEEGEV